MICHECKKEITFSDPFIEANIRIPVVFNNYYHGLINESGIFCSPQCVSNFYHEYNNKHYKKEADKEIERLR